MPGWQPLHGDGQLPSALRRLQHRQTLAAGLSLRHPNLAGGLRAGLPWCAYQNVVRITCYLKRAGGLGEPLPDCSPGLRRASSQHPREEVGKPLRRRIEYNLQAGRATLGQGKMFLTNLRSSLGCSETRSTGASSDGLVLCPWFPNVYSWVVPKRSHLEEHSSSEQKNWDTATAKPGVLSSVPAADSLNLCLAR